MADYKTKYGTNAAITITLASLASDTNLLAGREGTAIDNTSELAVEILISGHIKVNATVTTGREIDIYVFCDDGNARYPDVLDGTDSNETITSAAIRNGMLKLLHTIYIDGTASATYEFVGLPVSGLFGGVVPKKVGTWVVHNTGNAFSATGGDHEMRYQVIQYQSV